MNKRESLLSSQGHTVTPAKVLFEYLYRLRIKRKKKHGGDEKPGWPDIFREKSVAKRKERLREKSTVSAKGERRVTMQFGLEERQKKEKKILSKMQKKKRGGR